MSLANTIRVEVKPGMFHPLHPCALCGDDMELHEWIEFLAVADPEHGIVTVDCDRSK